jgi:hypothetical protein
LALETVRAATIVFTARIFRNQVVHRPWNRSGNCGELSRSHIQRRGIDLAAGPNVPAMVIEHKTIAPYLKDD